MSLKSLLAFAVKLPFVINSSPLVCIYLSLDVISLYFLERALLFDLIEYASSLSSCLTERLGANDFIEMLLDLFDLTDTSDGAAYLVGCYPFH